MPTKKLKHTDKQILQRLGKKIEHLILKEKGYRSLDAFSLEFHDEIAKPTLYQICEGKRDMKFSTVLGLSRALDISLSDLLNGI
jgi:hypothetical protein